MCSSQHFDRIVSIATERPAHHTHKCLVHLGQLHDLLCHRICIVLFTTSVCNQQAHFYAIRKFSAVIKLLLRNISALEIIVSHTHCSSGSGEHCPHNHCDIWIAWREHTLIFFIDDRLGIICI